MQAPEWLVRVWEPVAPYADRLAVWQGYERELQTLLIAAVGIAVYTLLVFAFYQNLSQRQALKLQHPAGRWRYVTRFFEGAFLFPLVNFLFFAMLASSLFFLAKDHTTPTILLLSMAVVVGVRVTAYLSELASVDLAKLLPLSLLGVLLVSPSYQTLGAVWARFQEVPGLMPLIARYFLLFIVLEGVMKGIRGTYRRLTLGRGMTRKPTKEELIEGARSVPVKSAQMPVERER